MQAGGIAAHHPIDLRYSLSSVSDIRKRILSWQRDNATVHRWQSEIGLLIASFGLRRCDGEVDSLNWAEEMSSIRSWKRHVLRLTSAIHCERVKALVYARFGVTRSSPVKAKSLPQFVTSRGRSPGELFALRWILAGRRLALR